MDKLRQLRIERDLSQAKTAVLAGMDPTTYNRLEQGKGNPNLRTLERVAEVFGVSVAELLESESPKARSPLPLEGGVGGVTDPTRAAELIQGTGDLAVALAAVWNQDVALYEHHGRAASPARLYEMQAVLVVLNHQFWSSVEILQRHAQSIDADPDVTTWTARAKQGLLEALTSICALAELYEVIRRSAAQSGADRDDLRAMREEYDVGARVFFTEDPQWPELYERARAAVGLA